jgi:hypothetical protein
VAHAYVKRHGAQSMDAIFQSLHVVSTASLVNSPMLLVLAHRLERLLVLCAKTATGTTEVSADYATPTVKNVTELLGPVQPATMDSGLTAHHVPHVMWHARLVLMETLTDVRPVGMTQQFRTHQTPLQVTVFATTPMDAILTHSDVILTVRPPTGTIRPMEFVMLRSLW